MSKVRVGMISYDHIHAEFRSRALCEMADDVSIVAIAEENEMRGNEAVKKFGGTYYKDYRNLLDRDDVDLVFIHSANNTHKEIALRAIEAGKHLFCEKPLATTAADAKAMVDAVTGSGLRHAVGFCSRFIPEAERAREIISQGLLGKLLTTKALIDSLGSKRSVAQTTWLSGWPIQSGEEGAHLSMKGRMFSTYCIGAPGTSNRFVALRRILTSRTSKLKTMLSR